MINYFDYYIIFCVATLKLSQFHQNILQEFEPLVEGYLNRLNFQIKSDMLAFFKQETWMPVS